MMDPNISQAWKVTLTPVGLRNYPHSSPTYWVVKNSDGTGNVVDPDGSRIYTNGVSFDEVEDHKGDPREADVVEVDPASVPAA